ncbi:hypothetical protein [Acidihalobacter aeolianus]|nr:hypothetical protein [Acidihalobacter aeolianus]
MWKTWLVGLILLSATGSAAAIEEMPIMNCADWINYRTSSDQGLQAIAAFYLAGAMNGIALTQAAYDNINKLPKFEPLSELGAPAQAYYWMDNYCRQHPLSDVMTGAINLYTVLEKRLHQDQGH